MWEKEKLLFTSNFSFSYSVFQGLFGKGLKDMAFFDKGLIFCVCKPTIYMK